jgi:hypothetical protein
MTRDTELRIRIDCRNLTVRESMARVLPLCLEAHVRCRKPVVVVQNLDLLADSVSGLLKSLQRLAGELDAKILLDDRSGFVDAFRNALSGKSHLLPLRA